MGAFKGKDWIKNLIKRENESMFLLDKVTSFLNVYKLHILKGSMALGILTIVTVSGNQYVKNNTTEIYHVYVGDQEIGIVNDIKHVEQFIVDKFEKAQQSHPDMRIKLASAPINYQSEKLFKPQANESDVLDKLDGLVTAQVIGTELKVDGKVIAVVKDDQTARQILEQIKNKYAPEKDSKKVGILSASDKTIVAQKLQSVEFTQDVEVVDAAIDPNDIIEPDALIKKLETGGVKPITYIVQEGDCISCIAAKFHIDKQVIYDRNPWIVDDMIRPGDELDITVLQPTLSVRTVEKFVENQEIQFDTDYQEDDSLIAGRTRIIRRGKNGLKKITYQLTKINGQVIKEELAGEEILQEPVTALAARGTKIVLGQGSGRFAWPVVGAKLTSGFGMRWGKMHDGVDLASANRSILASDTGKVVFSGVKNGYGTVIVLDHLNGYQTLYAHLSRILVGNGEVVEKGEKIGIMGSTGDSTGVHLHFEVRVDNDPQNPLKFLR